MKFRFQNLKKILLSVPSMVIGILVGTGLRFLIKNFSDRPLIAGNYGHIYALINYVVDIFSVIGITLFVASLVYKITTFKTIKNTNHGGRIGGFLSALVAGCGSCSLTLATYIGLAGIIGLLPWGGLEVKLLGLFILGRSVWKNIKDLLLCKIN